MNTVIMREGFDPAQDGDNGNRFLNGNGYMGVRGTICEAGPEQMAAVNLAGIHHQKGDAWEEPLNAPNPLYAALEGYELPEAAEKIRSHRLALDIADGVFTRETVFEPAGLTLRQDRFCAVNRFHLLAQRLTLKAERETRVTLCLGIDSRVWDLHGPHYETLTIRSEEGILSALGTTDDGKSVCTALRLPAELRETTLQEGTGLIRAELSLQAGKEIRLDAVAAIYTSQDGLDPEEAARAAAAEAPDFDALLSEQREGWRGLWERARVEIDGDPQAEFAVNYSLYHLLSIAPRHAKSLSVPARGLSGQTYKGAIFWDTEVFMLDFYLNCLPEVARACLKYRIDSLPAAKEKARSYGLEGAFYAWESVEGGRDACSDYNVTDVFTGRPMRTYFKDRQIHISAAVVYGLKKYLEATGDDSLLREGGAEVMLECARFYRSLMTKRIIAEEYDLLDVIGPDEYHEHVNNNAYTNEMARMTLEMAAAEAPKYLAVSDEEIAAFREAAARLKEQKPLPESGIIPQFDGYFALEDTTVDAVRSRLLDPREYWGGAYGVASQTQVIKQADVIAMLCMRGEKYGPEIWEANYDYYEPRTEHGSSLSACMYALCACEIGRPEAAYPLFLKSAEADIRGGGKQWAGLVWIGGTHPAAAGGAYMVLLRGFLGMKERNGEISFHPRMPEGWKRVKLSMIRKGKSIPVTMTSAGRL